MKLMHTGEILLKIRCCTQKWECENTHARWQNQVCLFK